MVETDLDHVCVVGDGSVANFAVNQGLSAAVSNIQTNLFGLTSYYERLQLMRDNKNKVISPECE